MLIFILPLLEIQAGEFWKYPIKEMLFWKSEDTGKRSTYM
jgi:hypothetical protein